MMKTPLFSSVCKAFFIVLLFFLALSICHALDIIIKTPETESRPTLLEVRVPQFPLSMLEAIAPEEALEVNGNASLHLLYDGENIKATLTLASANIKSKSYGLELKDVNGHIVHDDKAISFVLAGIWKDAEFNCKGLVEEKEDGFVIKESVIESNGNRVVVEGRINKNPLTVMAHFSSFVKADKVAGYLPQPFAQRVAQFQLAGDIFSEGEFVWDGGKMRAEGEVGSQHFAFGKIHFEDISSPFTLEGKTLDFPNITAKFYQGVVNAKTKIKFGDFLLESEGNMEEVQLGELLGKRGVNASEDVKGVLKSSFHISSNALDRQALTGGLSVNIREGDLVKLPLLLGILHMLNLTKFGRLLVDEADGDFTIGDGKLKTQDFIFSSQSTLLKFAMNGSVDLWGNLDLRCTVRLPQKFHRRIPWIFNLPALIISKTGEVVLPGVRITGTLAQPAYSITPIFGGVRQSIENLQGR